MHIVAKKNLTFLDYYDAIKSDYGFDSDGSRSDPARTRPVTDYAKCQGANVADSSEMLAYWWLRTTALYGAFAFGVSPSGWIVSSGGGYYNVNRTDNAVVPAFKFNPKTPTFAKGSKLEFGSYPQSEFTDADEIAKLEVDSKNYLWVSYKYYSGTGDSTDGKMEPGDFMLYKDFYSGGEMFRAVTFSEYRPSTGGGLKEHAFEWVTDKEATETETVIAHEECSVCHAKRNENTEVFELPTKWDNIRDWFISIIAKIIKWFIDLIGDIC